MSTKRPYIVKQIYSFQNNYSYKFFGYIISINSSLKTLNSKIGTFLTINILWSLWNIVIQEPFRYVECSRTISVWACGFLCFSHTEKNQCNQFELSDLYGISFPVWDIVFAVAVTIVKVNLGHKLFTKEKTIFPVVARKKN